MRRLSRRLSERTRLKSITSLLVGIGLVTGMGAAQGGSLLEPGTTTYRVDSELRSDTPLEIGAAHTVILDASQTFFLLDAPLVNHGVVRWASAGLAEDTPRDLGLSEKTQVNHGQWILEDNLLVILASAFDNQGGRVLIGKHSELLAASQAFVGGRVHGESDTSLLSVAGLKDATITGQVDLRPSWMEPKPVALAGTLTVDGVLRINSVALSESTLLRGTGRTVLNNAMIGAESGLNEPKLTVGSGHTLSGTGHITNVAVLNQGTIEVDRADVLRAESVIVQQVDEARLVVKGNLQTPGIQIQAGALDLHNTSYVTGDVDLQAGRLMLHQFSVVEPASLGLGAIIEGDLTLSDQSTVEVIVDHDGDHFATLEIWGNASLGGDLIVSFVDGVKVPSTFDILFMGSNVQGSFRSLRVNGSGNLPWKFVQNSNGQVSITAVPEPGTWGLMLCGLGVIGWRLRRRAALHPTH